MPQGGDNINKYIYVYINKFLIIRKTPMVAVYQVSSQADLELIQQHRTIIGCNIKMIWNNYILQYLFLQISCVGTKLKVGDARLIIVPPLSPNVHVDVVFQCLHRNHCLQLCDFTIYEIKLNFTRSVIIGKFIKPYFYFQ